MDENISPQPSINSISNTPPPQTSQLPAQNKTNLIWIPLVLLPLLILVAAVLFFINNRRQIWQKKDVILNKETTIQMPNEVTPKNENSETVLYPGLPAILADLNSTYAGKLPWENINVKKSYQFYPYSIEDLVLSSNEITESYDDNYNAITKVTIGESAVPVKSSYIAHYELPESKNESYGYDRDYLVLPISISSFEFERPLQKDELAYVESSNFLKCTNTESKVTSTNEKNDEIVVSYCNANLTTGQKEKLAKRDYKDVYYVIYFKQRNILIQIAMDGRTLTNTSSYVKDYLSKIFSANENYVVGANQIQSVAKAREFAEWRKKTFSK
ncbi:MAG: hypothetical protein U0525_03665 [Patescibacteria group bacterium]